MKIIRISGAVGLALLLATAPVAKADNGHGGRKGQYKQKKQQCIGDRDQRRDRREQFDRADINRDGVISRGEFRGDSRAFDRLDRNRDGVLSRDEIRRNLENRDPRQFDRNGDGLITRSEFPGTDAQFDRLDRNDDGRLTAEELRRGRMNRNDRDNDFDDDDFDRDDDQMRFGGMDNNRDGIITRAEWRGNDRSFQNHDRNRDGRLSGREVRPGGRR